MIGEQKQDNYSDNKPDDDYGSIENIEELFQDDKIQQFDKNNLDQYDQYEYNVNDKELDDDEYGDEFIDLTSLQQDLKDFNKPNLFVQDRVLPGGKRAAYYEQEEDLKETFEEVKESEINNDQIDLELDSDFQNTENKQKKKVKFEEFGNFKGIGSLTSDLKYLNDLNIEDDENQFQKNIQIDQFVEKTENFEENNFQLDELPALIQDDEFEGNFENELNEQTTVAKTKGSSTKSSSSELGEDPSLPQFSGRNQGKDNLGHLRLIANPRSNNRLNPKPIDVRKGVSIEKTMQMVNEQGKVLPANQVGKPQIEVNVLQHSQSHFEGLQGVLLLDNYKKQSQKPIQPPIIIQQPSYTKAKQENVTQKIEQPKDSQQKKSEQLDYKEDQIVYEKIDDDNLIQKTKQSNQSNLEQNIEKDQQNQNIEQQKDLPKTEENKEDQINTENNEQKKQEIKEEKKEEKKDEIKKPEAKKKLNRADFMFKGKSGETLVKKAGDINGIEFKIQDLQDCKVFLLDHTAQITIDRCQRTIFYIAPIKASIFIRNCDDCQLTVACSQFRCRDLNTTQVFLYTPNDPIVESSTKLTFAPYNLKFSELQAQAVQADLLGEFKDDAGIVQKKVNKWNQIFDFTKKEDQTLNYNFIPPDQFKIVKVSELLSDYTNSQTDDDFLFELPVEFGGSLDLNLLNKPKDSLMAFDIRTGLHAAQKQFEKQADEQEQKQIFPESEIKKIQPEPEIKHGLPEPEIKPILLEPEIKQILPEPEIKHGLPEPEIKPILLEPEIKQIQPEPEIKQDLPEPEIKPILLDQEFKEILPEREIQSVLAEPEPRPILENFKTLLIPKKQTSEDNPFTAASCLEENRGSFLQKQSSSKSILTVKKIRLKLDKPKEEVDKIQLSKALLQQFKKQSQNQVEETKLKLKKNTRPSFLESDEPVKIKIKLKK